MFWRRLMRDVKAVLCIVGGVVFGAALVYAYAVGLSRLDEDSLEPSGARPDCRHYVAVAPSSPEAVTSSGYAEANAL